MDLSPQRPKDVNNQALKKVLGFSFLVVSFFFSYITENKLPWSISFRVMRAQGWTWNLPMPFPRWMEWSRWWNLVPSPLRQLQCYPVTQLLMTHAHVSGTSAGNKSAEQHSCLVYLLSGSFAWFSHVTLPGLRSSEAWPGIVCGALLSPSH